MNDIVYFVKDTPENEELRYSLRSLANFPHHKVWFYGGCPDGLKPDKHIYVKQNLENKWQNVGMMLKMACNNKDISKDFWLFNDDFFIMEKIEHPKNYNNGDLYKRIVQLEDSHQRITPYSQQLRDMCKELEAMGCTTINYTLHIPMLINRDKALELFNISDCPMFRSLYGNYYGVKSEVMHDVKIVNAKKEYKGGAYLSTDDVSFQGRVGEQIKATFPHKCKYEV